MRKTPWQQGVQPGRQASQDAPSEVRSARRVASARERSTICMSSASLSGSIVC